MGTLLILADLVTLDAGSGSPSFTSLNAGVRIAEDDRRWSTSSNERRSRNPPPR
jgi:hypothetical protein